MPDPKDIKISKFLSLILRHKPGTIGLTLDENGWANTQELICKANAGHLDLTLEQLKKIVQNNDKQRFAFSADYTRIRANQGHSVKVDLGLKVKIPPAVLYHGTAEKNIPSIRQQGLLKGQRHHVHLSINQETARRVGERYDKAVVISIQANRMHQDGYRFYLSENEIWLTDFVLPQYITFQS